MNIESTMYDYSRNGRTYSTPSMQLAVSRTDADVLTQTTSIRETSGKITSTSILLTVEK